MKANRKKAIRALALCAVLLGCAALQVSTKSLPTGFLGTVYAAQLAATGGVVDATHPYKWALKSGAPGAGLTLTSTGLISGTPTIAGTSSFTVQVSDVTGASAPASLSLTVAPLAPPAITTVSSSTASSTGLQLSLYAGGATITIGGSGFQPGANVQIGTAVVTPTSITSTQIVATSPLQTPAQDCMTGPNKSSLLNAPVQVGNPDGQTAVATTQITYYAPAKILTTGSIPPPQIGVPYSFQLLATCGSGGPYTWSIVSGTLTARDPKTTLVAKKVERRTF